MQHITQETVMYDRVNLTLPCQWNATKSMLFLSDQSKLFKIIGGQILMTGHDVNFCSDLPRRASEITFSLALFQLSLALEKLYIIIL